jgi:hypothetical protein
MVMGNTPRTPPPDGTPIPLVALPNDLGTDPDSIMAFDREMCQVYPEFIRPVHATDFLPGSLLSGRVRLVLVSRIGDVGCVLSGLLEQ